MKRSTTYLFSSAALQARGGTSSAELLNIMISYARAKNNYFRGVFPCDQIPLELCNLKKFSIIINLNALTGHNLTPGHWVALARNNRKVHYFDSYGTSCLNWHILAFLSNIDIELNENSLMIQALDSAACGYFAVLFIMNFEICLSEFSSEVLKKFNLNDTMLLNNDHACIQLIKKNLTKKNIRVVIKHD